MCKTRCSKFAFSGHESAICACEVVISAEFMKHSSTGNTTRMGASIIVTTPARHRCRVSSSLAQRKIALSTHPRTDVLAGPSVRREDVPLHDDVRWLAASLGRVIRRLEGEAAF